MSQQELLRRVIRVLEQAGIPYMLSGSVVSSLQGEPRSTHDIDLVVSLEKARAKELSRSFQPPDFYLDEDRIGEAIDSGGAFRCSLEPRLRTSFRTLHSVTPTDMGIQG